MNDLRDLYQEVILDHGKRPRHLRPLPEATRHAVGHNPLCGDRLTVFVRLEGDVIRDASFVGVGCAISQASADLMAEAVRGMTRAEAEGLFGRFHDLVTGHAGAVPTVGLGKLAVFAGVSEFPARVKCASLPWHTLKAALERATDHAPAGSVSTE